MRALCLCALCSSVRSRGLDVLRARAGARKQNQLATFASHDTKGDECQGIDTRGIGFAAADCSGDRIGGGWPRTPRRRFLKDQCIQ